MKFVKVDPHEAQDLLTREAIHRGRVSYPLLKSFLECKMFLARLDKEGLGQKSYVLTASLRAYAKSHNLPVEVFTRQGEVYFRRLDIDEDGKPVEQARLIDPDVVAEHA
jgi:hypothetical protein